MIFNKYFIGTAVAAMIVGALSNTIMQAFLCSGLVGVGYVFGTLGAIDNA